MLFCTGKHLRFAVSLLLAVLAVSGIFSADLYAEEKAGSCSPACRKLIEKISAEYDIDPLFVQAVIWRESRFKENSVGDAGEIGLMQVRMCTVRDWARIHGRKVPDRQEVFRTDLNLRIGIWRLDLALRNWEGYADQTVLALCEYNVGRTALLRYLAHCNGDVALLLQKYKPVAYARAITKKFEENIRAQDQGLRLAMNP